MDPFSLIIIGVGLLVLASGWYLQHHVRHF